MADFQHSNVQVTLQILRALIDKSPRDLALYAPYVLRILLNILNARDLTTVEDSVPTFQTFCEHQDTATLAADQELIDQYEDVAKRYASFARDTPGPSKVPLSAPVRIRWRTAGLQSIKSITGSEAITADGGKQIPLIVSTILDNLYRHSEDQLLSLIQRASADKETAIRRRMSIATVRTSESVPPAGGTAPTTTADADRLAEEEAGLLALQSMRQLFTANNRTQIRLATSSLLQFLMTKPLEPRPETAKSSTRSGKTGSWATTVMEMVTQVTPVQDRFIIVVTAMETLIRSSTSEETLGKQLVLTTLIESLLGSSINMIGLSTMDVLLGLIQHVLLLLQLGGKGTQILPHHQQTDAIDLFKENDEATAILSPDDSHLAEGRQSSTPSAARMELLSRLKRCIANLATHIYYSDQVTDIVSAILLRLKPSPASPISSAAAAVERPEAAAHAISTAINMKEDPSTDEFFSFATARVTALNAVKEVLLTANKRGAFVGAGAIGRNKVNVRVWEGTQWLLRDEDRRVRYAYADALLTWLRLETSREDLRVSDGRSGSKKPKVNGDVENSTLMAARASSNASKAGRPNSTKSNFLHLIHLAVYENILQSQSQSDVLLSHTLLVALVDKLGINAVQIGLPMLLRLQDDAASDAFRTNKAKIGVCSLVYGYLFYLSQRFELDTTMVGHEIQSEISQRRKAGTWLDTIRTPPLSVEHIASIPATDDIGRPQHAPLKRFANVSSLVDQIALAYSSAIQSPPTSPLASPSKSGAVASIPTPIVRSSATELPASVRESMMAKWTKESCIARVEKESTRTASPRGSRTGTSNSNPNGLLAANGHIPREPSPGMEASRSRTREGASTAPLPNLHTAGPRTSNPQLSGPPTPLSSSDQTYTLRVDDMKRVLAGGSLHEAFSQRQRQPSLHGGSPLRTSSTAQYDFALKSGGGGGTGRGLRGPSLMSAGSDSIVDAEGFESASEGDPDRPLPSPQPPPSSAEVAHQYLQQQRERRSLDVERSRVEGAASDGSRPESARGRVRSASQSSGEDPQANAKALKGDLDAEVVRGSIVAHDGVPPVPPLPEGLAGNSVTTNHASATNVSSGNNSKARRVESVRERSLGRGSDGRGPRTRGVGERRIMVQALLGSIEVSNDASKGIGLPPY